MCAVIPCKSSNKTHLLHYLNQYLTTDNKLPKSKCWRSLA